MPFDSSLAELLELATKADFDLIVVQKHANIWLKQEFRCEETAFFLADSDQKRYVCQICGTNEFLTPRDLGPSNVWQNLFSNKTHMEFKELPADLATNVSVVFDPIDVTVRAITLHPIRTSAGLLAILCMAHAEPRSMLCCRSKETFHVNNTLDNYLRAITSMMSIALSLEKQKTLTKQCECLLSTAQTVFSNLEDMTQLARNIIREAKRLVQCEICTLFIVDRENTELIAYVVEKNDLHDEFVTETRLAQNKGIVGAAAVSGLPVTVSDPPNHPDFDSAIDEFPNYKVRNMLCVPMKDRNGIIAVAELCNKNIATNFSERDEQAASSFGVYCSTSISHCLLYRRLQEAHRRSNVASELMMYHTQKIAEEDVLRLSLVTIPKPVSFGEEFCKFSFIPRSIPTQDTLMACLSMFEDLGFVSKFRIKRKTLSRFILLVDKGYRDVPYHNWSHAFSVAHFCYLVLKMLPLNQYLTDLERLSLFVACLCHDIDHRGTTNSFQVQSKTVLAQLYSSEGSVLERHHFAQTMCILNIENCNIFDALPPQDYQTVLDNMRDVILATDIAQHLRLRKGIEQIVHKSYSYDNKNNHYLLSCLLITACDLSDQTKKWTASKNIAGQIYTEFFSQGDLERAMGNTPNVMMDRERACVPKLQIDFLDTIALPCYKLLAKMFPDTQQVYATIYHSRRCWVMLHKILDQTNEGHSKCNLDIIHNSELETEVLRVVGPIDISPDDVMLTEKDDKS